MRFTSLLFLAGLVAVQVSAAPSPSFVVHEKRENTGAGRWSKRNAPPVDMIVPVRIGMRQSNLDVAHDVLMELSSHNSPKYGQHYTAQQVIDFFAPTEDTVSAIRSWLESTGIPGDAITQSTNKQWMQFDSSIADLERLLLTQYHVYGHSESGKQQVGCDEYSVPAAIQDHIDLITPGVKALTLRTRAKRDSEPSSPNPAPQSRVKTPLGMTALSKRQEGLQSCTASMTPQCIRALYNFTEASTAIVGNGFGLYESESFSQDYANEFFTQLEPRIPVGTGPLFASVDGGQLAPNGNLSEADLDLQVAYPILYPQNITVYQIDDPYVQTHDKGGFMNTFLDAIDGSYCSNGGYDPQYDPTYPDNSGTPGAYTGDYMCGAFSPTNVISVSYGDTEGSVSFNYVNRQCLEFLKLGYQGITVVVASGDTGVSMESSCYEGGAFAPGYPSSCPYVTAVGATGLSSDSDANGFDEVASFQFASGGGFSNYWPTPDYQTDAVATYMNNYKPPYPSYNTTGGVNIGANGGRFNAGGRGYPDVSAIGQEIAVVAKGSVTQSGGTSASAPLFGSLITRINDERLACGKSKVGFVNPVLYANAWALRDLTQGTNPGCGTDGFAAAPGWDPVTGLGTPQYNQLLEVFMAQP